MKDITQKIQGKLFELQDKNIKNFMELYVIHVSMR